MVQNTPRKATMHMAQVKRVRYMERYDKRETYIDGAAGT